MTPRIDEIVGRIRADIEAAEAARPGSTSAPEPPLGQLRRSPALAAVNRSFAIDPVGEIRSHRPVVGPVIVAAKRLVRRFVLAVLEAYFRKERELFADLARFQTEVAERSDRLADEIARQRRTIDKLEKILEDLPTSGRSRT